MAMMMVIEMIDSSSCMLGCMAGMVELTYELAS